jgi:hypothetical protein
MNLWTDHAAFRPLPSHRAFDAAVVITIGSECLFIDTVETARRCLTERFPDADGPSYRRALTACQACLLSGASSATAQIAFVVAAMEAGFPFEVIEAADEALERRTEIEAEAALRSILSDVAPGA